MASYPISGLLNQSVIVAPFVSRVDGDATYGTPCNPRMPDRLHYQTDIQRNRDGSHIYRHRVHRGFIGKEDKITFPTAR